MEYNISTLYGVQDSICILINNGGKRMSIKKNDKKHLGLTINPTLHAKLKYISKFYGRSISGQFIFIIRQCIAVFEKNHGVIEYNPDKEKEK